MSALAVDTRPIRTRSEWLLSARCVEKFRFWLQLVNLLAVQADQLLVARGSVKLAFRHSFVSSRRLWNRSHLASWLDGLLPENCGT